MNPNIQSHEPAAERLAPLVLSEMQRHRVLPVPDNYALWYAHLSGQSPELSKEISQIAEQKVAFSQQVNDYLREKYLRPVNRNAVEAVSHDTRQILNKVIGMVQEYSGDALAYHKQIGEHADRLELHGDEHDVHELLGEVVSQLRELQVSGDTFNSKMDESRREIESLRKNLDRITTESRRDFLTGVFNRRALDESMVAMVDEAREEGGELTFLMVDIDKFKHFNDQWGHAIGDEVLKTVAQVLKQSVRGKDVVARFGGEEFCVLLYGTPLQGARVVAETIRSTIAKASLKRRDTKQTLGQITVSIGISRFRHEEEDTIPFFIKRADDAMYGAKTAGRNRVVSELS